MSDAGGRTPYFMLSELLLRPELLVPPPAVLPHLAYAGRLTLLAGEAKTGKSTLLGQGAAMLTRGLPFLGGGASRGPVIWLAIDEPVGDSVRRFAGFGAADHVAIFTMVPPMAEWPAILADIRPVLVVVDTLLEFAAGYVEDPYSAMAWQPVLKHLREMAQQSGAAFVLLHHLTKNGARYADSRQLGAGVDVIAEVAKVESDPAIRRLKIRGRMGYADLSLTFNGRGYDLAGAELPLGLRVYRAIESTPGRSTRQVRDAVGGRAQAVASAIAQLERQQAIENRGSKAAAAWYVRSPASVGYGDSGESPEPLRETLPGNGVTPCEPMGETLGKHSREARVVPGPLKGPTGTTARGPLEPAGEALP
jgi:hypothetical protein